MIRKRKRRSPKRDRIKRVTSARSRRQFAKERVKARVIEKAFEHEKESTEECDPFDEAMKGV